MKKNISINISGIIFHIEEDGYENLRRYLDSIHKYFSSFEDSTEIMADIESRIAEIFLSKLNEGKQIITADDVNALITTMGSVSDFKAAEEQEPIPTENINKQTSGSSGPSSVKDPSSPKSNFAYTRKQLKRDQQRKILGGVCAGLAHYANIDAVWLRLIFAILTFATYGIALVVYLVMWIVIPGSYTLDEPVIDKKMFRSVERKVLGGVSGGLASYFGVDIVVIRVLFVVFTFAALFGALIYCVLWVVLPEAKSLTDRMQMQGEAVTLSNIDSNIKKNKISDLAQEEGAFTKILLFPFRLIGMIATALSKIIAPLVDILRVGIGVVVILFGVGLTLAVVVSGGMVLGIFSSTAFSVPWGMESEHLAIPIEAMTRAFPVWIAVATFVACMVPAIFIILLGSSIIAKRITFSSTAGWTYFVLFFVSIIILSIGIPKMVYMFKEEGSYKVETSYQAPLKRAVLQVNEVGMDDYHNISLTLQGYAGKDFKLVQDFHAKGSTRQKAIVNAQMVSYHVKVQDSVFIFDSNITFKEDAVFRAQGLHLTLNIPYNFPFTISEDASRFITQHLDGDYSEGDTWRVTPKGLECVSCPPQEISPSYEGTSEIELNGLFDVTIRQGQEYAVEVTGEENEKGNYSIERHDKTLVISYDNKKEFTWKDFLNMGSTRIIITMPELERIEAEGAGKIEWDGFHSDTLTIDLTGVVKAKGKMDANNVTTRITGASQLELQGNGQSLEADIEGTSTLRAFKFQVQNARIEVNGISSAEVNVTETLEMEEAPTSDIDFRGNPHVVNHD